jgi:hypothetical protein
MMPGLGGVSPVNTPAEQAIVCTLPRTANVINRSLLIGGHSNWQANPEPCTLPGNSKFEDWKIRNKSEIRNPEQSRRNREGPFTLIFRI